MSRAVIALEPSVPFIAKFLSAVLTVNSTSVELFAISSIDVPPSLNITLPPSASKTMSVVASSVIVEPESISAITGVVEVLFVSVFDVAENYVSKSVTATCFIVPASL